MPYRKADAEKRLSCPRCVHEGARLSERSFRDLTFGSCEACGGLWLPNQAFNAIYVDPGLRRGLLEANPGRLVQGDVKYSCCPVCQAAMEQRNFGGDSGVLVDRCRRHGLWLDNGELAALHTYLSGAPAGVGRTKPTSSPEKAGRIGDLSDGRDNLVLELLWILRTLL